MGGKPTICARLLREVSGSAYIIASRRAKILTLSWFVLIAARQLPLAVYAPRIREA
jgi:hypothetical protein